jgi:hypothetical protein
MKRMFRYCLVAIFLLAVYASAFAQTNKVLRSATEANVPGGLATLYALDPLAHTLCFHDGQNGYVVQQNEIKNRCTDLEFNSYDAGGFTVAVEGGRAGNIIDLGTAGELKQRYGYAESSLSTGQGFASIRLENGKVVILKDQRSFQELKESAELFKPGKINAASPIKLGHIYLVRLTDTNDKSFQMLAKFVVVSYVPNESVAIRWQLFGAASANPELK